MYAVVIDALYLQLATCTVISTLQLPQMSFVPNETHALALHCGQLSLSLEGADFGVGLYVVCSPFISAGILNTGG
jgi:hypothetical protein